METIFYVFDSKSVNTGFITAGLHANLPDKPNTVVKVDSASLHDPVQKALELTPDTRTRAIVLPATEELSRIRAIRSVRKDIYLAVILHVDSNDYTTVYQAGLDLMKRNSVNLVFAIGTDSVHMLITPERYHYHMNDSLEDALYGLGTMVALRTQSRFTRSTVVEGDAVSWRDERVPASLQTVVDHCITRGAYKRFNGVTVGHFAVRVDDGSILTSKRWSDFNRLDEVGLVRVDFDGDMHVIAHGSKPSVGGQSQRAIFRDHPEADCVVHFHCPQKPGSSVPVRSQYEYECGSHECGENTSSGLGRFGKIKAVMLDGHGPNIVFPRSADPSKVIDFIEEHFDLPGRTDYLLDPRARPLA